MDVAERRSTDEDASTSPGQRRGNSTLTERARAKINLTLRIVGRRADGYHLLESFVAFADDLFDDLAFAPQEALSLTVDGPMADDAGSVDDNLVLKAARELAARCDKLALGAFHLTKRIPVAAGLGGGSADAAAALRLLARANRIALDDGRLQSAARAVGADVLVCLESRARMMRGVGDELDPPTTIALLPALLVNPRVACPTPNVFRAFAKRQQMSAIDLRNVLKIAAPDLNWFSAHANDLEASAIEIAPVISDILPALRALPGCRLARMSGSGATCFGLFDNDEELRRAEHALRRSRPDWWIAATSIQ